MAAWLTVRVARLRDGCATLWCDGAAVTPVEIAASYRARTRGLLSRDGIDGALLLSPSGSVHTIGMRFPIDVAYLTKDMRVLRVVRMKRHRLGMIRFRSRHVLEAEWGAFDRWGVKPGAQLSVE